MPLIRVDGYPRDACTTSYLAHGIVTGDWVAVLSCGCACVICDGCKQEIERQETDDGHCHSGHPMRIVVFVPLDEDPEAFKQLTSSVLPISQ